MDIPSQAASLGMDKRKFPRANIELAVRIKPTTQKEAWANITPQTAEWISAWSENVSGGGLSLRSDVALKRGDIVKIDLEVPEQRHLRAFAEVVWVQAQDKQHLSGIQFIAVKDEDVEILSRYVLAFLQQNGAL